jgi:uncharacterized membrane protein YcaP (DUF421 family)
VIFIITALLLRFLGKRSLGMKMPLDYVITMLLGGILGRTVVGISPFIPTLCAAATIVLLHRLGSVLSTKNKWWGKMLKGSEEKVYGDGRFNPRSMNNCLVTEHDLESGVRECLNENDLHNVESIYVERTGKITVIKKTKT